uniref:hypothetical protein n=1 Tax=Clavibacter michiganensis TaxID=28447 RepID=UPI00292E155C
IGTSIEFYDFYVYATAAVRAAGVVDMRGDGFRLVRRERQGRADGAGAPVGRGRRVRRSRGGHS